MIMHTEIVGLPQSGKTSALLALYHSFEARELNPIMLLPTEEQARSFRKHFAINTSTMRAIHGLNSHKAFLIDGTEFFPPDRGEGDILALVKKRLQLHTGLRIIVSTRTAEPCKTGG